MRSKSRSYLVPPDLPSDVTGTPSGSVLPADGETPGGQCAGDEKSAAGDRRSHRRPSRLRHRPIAAPICQELPCKTRFCKSTVRRPNRRPRPPPPRSAANKHVGAYDQPTREPVGLSGKRCRRFCPTRKRTALQPPRVGLSHQVPQFDHSVHGSVGLIGSRQIGRRYHIDGAGAGVAALGKAIWGIENDFHGSVSVHIEGRDAVARVASPCPVYQFPRRHTASEVR